MFCFVARLCAPHSSRQHCTASRPPHAKPALYASAVVSMGLPLFDAVRTSAPTRRIDNHQVRLEMRWSWRHAATDNPRPKPTPSLQAANRRSNRSPRCPKPRRWRRLPLLAPPCPLPPGSRTDRRFWRADVEEARRPLSSRRGESSPAAAGPSTTTRPMCASATPEAPPRRDGQGCRSRHATDDAKGPLAEGSAASRRGAGNPTTASSGAPTPDWAALSTQLTRTACEGCATASPRSARNSRRRRGCPQ